MRGRKFHQFCGKLALSIQGAGQFPAMKKRFLYFRPLQNFLMIGDL